MPTISDEDEDADVERLFDVMEDVAEKVGGPVLLFDGKNLRVHPDLVMQLAKPENNALVHLLAALDEDMRREALQ